MQYLYTIARPLDSVRVRKKSIRDMSMLALCTQGVAFMLHTGDGIYDQIL